jgi:hypothetical protein
MKSRNIYWFIAGIINFFTFLLHLIGGQFDLVIPLTETSLIIERSSQWLGVWHMVSIVLLASSVILLLAGFNKKYGKSIELIQLLGYLYVLFCIPFLIAGFYYGLLVPQWILCLPIGALALFGVRRFSDLKTQTL